MFVPECFFPPQEHIESLCSSLAISSAFLVWASRPSYSSEQTTEAQRLLVTKYQKFNLRLIVAQMSVEHRLFTGVYGDPPAPLFSTKSRDPAPTMTWQPHKHPIATSPNTKQERSLQGCSTLGKYLPAAVAGTQKDQGNKGTPPSLLARTHQAVRNVVLDDWESSL